MTRTRRGALIALLLVLGLLVVLSWLASCLVGWRALDGELDHRLDLVIDAARSEPVTSDVDAVRPAGQALVRDGRIAAGSGVAAPPSGSPVERAVLEAAATGEAVQADADLGDRSVRVRAQPLASTEGEVPVLVGVITRDTGAAGRLAATLAVVHLSAFVAVSLLAYVLARRSSRVVEDLFRQQDRLMQAVAHEIRSPLARLLAVVDEGLAGTIPATGALKEVSAHGDTLNELIDDLLHAARVMSGALPLPQEVVRLDEIVSRLHTTRDLGAASIVLDTTPATVVGSRRLLRLAIGNLVDNAARHAYHGGPGDIRVRVDADGVTVADDGPGVPEALLAKLNADIPLGRSPGGLGLVLSAWVTEAHGGNLRLANRPEGGFVVCVELPVQPVQRRSERRGLAKEKEPL